MKKKKTGGNRKHPQLTLHMRRGWARVVYTNRWGAHREVCHLRGEMDEMGAMLTIKMDDIGALSLSDGHKVKVLTCSNLIAAHMPTSTILVCKTGERSGSMSALGTLRRLVGRSDDITVSTHSK